MAEAPPSALGKKEMYHMDNAFSFPGAPATIHDTSCDPNFAPAKMLHLLEMFPVQESHLGLATPESVSLYISK
jgi:hypothetical protein